MENVSMCLLSTIQRSITSSTMHMGKPRLCVFECLPKVGQLTTGVRREPRQSDFAGRTRTSCTYQRLALTLQHSFLISVPLLLRAIQKPRQPALLSGPNCD